MPHVIIKLYPGRSDKEKKNLAEKIAQTMVAETGCTEKGVSVAFEEVDPDNWATEVYQQDILDGTGVLYKKPGYNPFDTSKRQPSSDQDLMTFVRGACETAAKEDTSGMFNPMSWLDLELEDTPHSFDPFFDRPWQELSEMEKTERAKEIRAVL